MSGTSKACTLWILSFTTGDLGHRASQSLESCHVVESETALTFLTPYGLSWAQTGGRSVLLPQNTLCDVSSFQDLQQRSGEAQSSLHFTHSLTHVCK